MKYRFFILLSIFSFMLLSCEKDAREAITPPDNQNPELATKSAYDDLYTWVCDACNTRNSKVFSICRSCGTEYSPEHVDYIIERWREVQTIITTFPIQGEAEQTVQLASNLFTAIEVPAWYNTSHSISIYNSYLNSLVIPPDYVEAFNYAWYKTTRILYPGQHNKNSIESSFTRWRLSVASVLTGQKGSGLKDGTQAAVEAFVDY